MDFVFLDMKQHASYLDKEMHKELKKLEKLVAGILTSRKKMDAELIGSSFPQIFSLRIKGLEWLGKEKRTLPSVLSEVSPILQNFSSDPRLKKIASALSEAFITNQKMAAFFSDAGFINEKNLKPVSMAGFEYTSFVVALQFMPGHIRKLLSGMMDVSLQIEFVSMAAAMLFNNEVACSDLKMIQLTQLAASASHDYKGCVNQLLNMAQGELFVKEKNEWDLMSYGTFSGAYSANEPDYENSILKEPNPHYQK